MIPKNNKLSCSATKLPAGFSLPLIDSDSGAWVRQFKECLTPGAEPAATFATPNDIHRELPTMRLRVFGTRRRDDDLSPTLIIAPHAVHDASLADLLRGHSLVEALRQEGHGQVFLTDWRSATPDMRHLTIDSYLSDLNVAIDDLGGRVNVIGLCQGGLLSLIHAARFPSKIERLVLAGTAVDFAVKGSALRRHVTGLAPEAVEALATSGDGIVSGSDMLAPLGAGHGLERAAIATLQRNPSAFGARDMKAIAAFETWSRRSLDLPGRACAQWIEWIHRDNRLARGTLSALGQTIDLKRIRIPIFVLTGTFDEIAPKSQAMAVFDLVGTAKARTRNMTAPCGHFSLFIGGQTLSREWRTIGNWLRANAALGRRKFPSRDAVA